MIPRRAARLLCAIGLALSVVSPGRARAQDDATVEMARQRFREGVQFYDQRQYDKARLAFLQAYALKPHPSVLLNLAQSELRAGHPDDASGHFNEYLRTNTEASEAEKQEAELGLAASKSKVAEVAVSVDVAGAQISVDGAEKGVAPLAGPLYLMPGAHTIEAKANDKHAAKSGTFSAGQSASFSLALRASQASPPPPPAAAEESKAEEPEAEPEEKPERAAPAEEATAAPAAESSSGGRKGFFPWLGDTPLAMVGLGVGVVGVGVSIGFGISASQDYSTANASKDALLSAWSGGDYAKVTAPPNQGDQSVPCNLSLNAQKVLGADRTAEYAQACDKYKSAADSGDTKKTIAIVSGVVGGVAIVGTVVYYFVDSPAERTSARVGGFQARIVPMSFGGGSSGIGLVGTF
jgi:hypothetical protein